MKVQSGYNLAVDGTLNQSSLTHSLRYKGINKYRIRPIYRTVRLVFSKLQEKSDMKNRSKKRTPGTKK